MIYFGPFSGCCYINENKNSVMMHDAVQCKIMSILYFLSLVYIFLYTLPSVLCVLCTHKKQYWKLHIHVFLVESAYKHLFDNKYQKTKRFYQSCENLLVQKVQLDFVCHLCSNNRTLIQGAVCSREV